MTLNAHGDFIWYELLTLDPQASLAFYESVFGWTTAPSDQSGANAVLVTAQGPFASVSELPALATAMGAGPFWNSVVQVSDVDRIVARAKELGGRVYHEPTDYPGAGRIAVVADPFGAVLNVMTPVQTRSGHERSESGEVCWHELLSEDHEVAFSFWSELFGWTKSGDFDMEEMGKYLLFGRDGADFGGTFTKPQEVQNSAWVYYFQVSGLDATADRAVRQGGKLCKGPMQLASGARIAQLSDPQGALFALHENPSG